MDFKIGIITKAISGFYYVRSENAEFECKARGIFRKKGVPPLVGDRVKFSCTDQSGIIEEVLPRKNCLSRPPIANLDRLYIVSSFCSPAPNTLNIDKITVLAEEREIEPVIVFNKSDQGDFSEIAETYEKAGFQVFVVSCKTGQGIDALKNDFVGAVCAFTGNSGVGKSSLLNLIDPALLLKTGEISEKLGRGRHTTTYVELFFQPNGGYIADTPGFSSLETSLLKGEIAANFRDFKPFIGECKFTSCSHTGEKGCAIVAAVNDGKIAKSRFESYCEMYKEAQLIKEWEYKKEN